MTTNDSPTPETRWQRMRRNGAFQAAVIFASAAWLGLQAADIFGLPTTAVRVVGAVLLAIFVVLTIYAWVRTGEPKTGSSRTRRSAPVLVAAGTLIGLGAIAWFARPALFGGVKPGADVIAVLPFSTSGPSVALLGEGLVDLLSTNLNAVGPIRTVDPRTTLHRWRQAAMTGGVDLDGSLAIGRAVNAGSVLVGSVVEAGGTVRLNAELFAVNGNRLASADVQGSADSVFALVDDLSVRLVRDIRRSREPIPELRVSALTTASPAALRAFLAGEQFFRKSQWDSARTSFERAVSDDSTFALAYARLSETYGWTESLGAPAAQRASQAAERLGASRLPARDWSLLVANRLHEATDLAALDSIRLFVQRYPDDAAGWNLLAEVQFHANALLDIDTAAFFEPFDRVLELDPSFTPALEHPIQYALQLGDRGRYEHYMSRLRAQGPGAQVQFFQALGDVRFGVDADQRLGSLSTALRTLIRNGYDINRLMQMTMSSALAERVPDAESIEAGYDTAATILQGPPPATRIGILITRAQVAASLGRVRHAHTLIDSLRLINPGATFGVVASLLTSGLNVPDLGAVERRLIENPPASGLPPQFTFWLAFVANMEGNPARARGLLDGLPADDPLLPGTLVDAMRGLIRVQEGDTVGGMQYARDRLRAGGYSQPIVGYAGALAFELAFIEMVDPAKRTRAIERVSVLMAVEPVLQIMLLPRLAAVYERVGEYDRAAAVLARLIAIWETGDPEMQAAIAEARRSLQRVTAEKARD